MSHAVSSVKQLLRVSYEKRSVEALQRAVAMLQQETSSAINAPSEMYILSCETAMELGEWGIAERCLCGFKGRRTATRGLEARALYCDGLVGLQNISSVCRGGAKVDAHLRCATKIVTGIKIALEEWPREAYTLTHGIEHLWLTICDLFNPGTFENVVDIVIFVVALHEKLSLGGPFSHLQWIMRYAVCLRGIGRFQDMATQLSVASDMITKVGSERLQLQFFRIQIALSASLPGTRPKQDYSRPVPQALYAVQAFFCGITDEATARTELVAAHDRLLSDPEKKETKSKSKKAMELEMTFSDPTLVMDTLSEVVLGLALCGADDVCRVNLSKLLQSESVRPRLFGEYAQAILRARECGALGASKALDASYLKRGMADDLFNCIKTVEGTMDSTRMIEDPSDRSYTLEIGCVILWNLCLPLLQPETRGKLRHTLKRIAMLLAQCNCGMKGLRVRVAYESSLIEFEEDNLNSAIEQVEKALSLDFFTMKNDGSILFPMDFALLWLKRRAVVRKAIDGSVFPSQEDQAIHFIEQARTATSESNRLVLLQSAANKLPPIGTEVDASVKLALLPKATQRKKSRGAKPKKLMISDVADEENQNDQQNEPHMMTNPIVANVYYLLLKEAKELKKQAVNPIIKKVASALTTIDIIPEENEKDLLLMKAEAHLSMAEVLATADKTPLSADSKSTSTTDVMMHISSAAKIGVKLCNAGYREEWVVVNACLSLINWYTESFQKGHFLPAAAALGELYLSLNQIQVDPVREFKVFNDIGFGYVMSFLQAYIAIKGEMDNELSCESLADTLQKTFLYPVCEANNPTLRQASDVCVEMMHKWQLPSCRKHFCLIYTCINRLLQRNQETFAHPQDQLLILLGRLNGPMQDSEKHALINKECLELVKIDPSVELCGRLAEHSLKIPENERTTLEFCRIADTLYRSGKLGWGTKMPATQFSIKEKGHTMSAASLASTSGYEPKPCDEDWYWYANILLHQATVLLRLGTGIERSKRRELEKRVLVTITNSAIAASHGPVVTQASQIVESYQAFCTVAHVFSGASRQLLLPSLQMLLSPFMLAKLRISGSRITGHIEGQVDKEGVYALLSSMASFFLTGLAEKGAYKEGIKAMSSFLGVLPPKYHKIFRAYEAEFRCHLGLPTQQLLQKVKGGDAETESAVWVAVAQSASSISESTKAWTRALTVLTDKPPQRADLLLRMVEWMASRNAISTKDLTNLLLSALDSVEHFDELYLRFSNNEQKCPMGSDKNLRQLMTSSLGGRTTALSSSLTFGGSMSRARQTGLVVDTPSLRDVVTAIRILYLLFLVAPDESEGETIYTSSKRSLGAVIVHYVHCMWNIVALRIRSTDVDWNDEIACKNRSLDLPAELHQWLGFHADSLHVDAIRIACPDDAMNSTDNFQAMLLDVSNFFIEEANMEPYAFILLSWVDFAARWRYGSDDPRAVAVVRMTRLKSFIAAARLGCGDFCSIYSVDTPSAAYWSAIQETLLSADAPSSAASDAVQEEFNVKENLSFSTLRGATHRCVLAEAEMHCTLGRLDDAIRWSAGVAECAVRISDHIAATRCQLLLLRIQTLKGDSSGAAAALLTLCDNWDPRLPLTLWVNAQMTRFDALLACLRLEEAISVVRKLESDLQSRTKEDANVTGVASDVRRHVAERCRRHVLCDSSQRLSNFLTMPLHRFCFLGKSEDAVRRYLDESCKQLLEIGDVNSRLVALRLRQQLRPFVDETLLLGVTATEGRDLLALLHAEYELATQLVKEIRDALALMAPISLSTRDTTTNPSIAVALNEAQVLRARNCIERETLRDFILLRYGQLSLSELGMPTTTAPRDLEVAVLRYMRDPTMSERASVAADEAETEASSETEAFNVDAAEVSTALMHFSIPAAHLDGVCGEASEALLYSCNTQNNTGGMTTLVAAAAAAAAAVGSNKGGTNASNSMLAVEASVLASSLTLRRRLRVVCAADDCQPTSTDEFGDLANRTLSGRWDAPIAVPERLPAGRVGRKETIMERKRGRHVPEQPPPEPPSGGRRLLEVGSLSTILKLAVGGARRFFDFRRMAHCYLSLAHAYMLAGEATAAGTAVEFAQAAEMSAFIMDVHAALASSTPESTLLRLVERLRGETPYLLNTPAFDGIRTSLFAQSDMLRRLDLVGEWPSTPSAPSPLSNDCCTLSVVREGSTSHFLIALRRHDGEVHSRRVRIDVKAILEYANEFETAKRLRKSEVVAAHVNRQINSSFPVGGIGSERSAATLTACGGDQDDVACTVLFQSILERLRLVTESLWVDFIDVFNWLSPTCHLFLCLDPVFQGLPIEQLPVFESFLSVQRELSVMNVRQKLANRVGKTLTSGLLVLIDPYGEHATSQQFFGGNVSGSGGAPSTTGGAVLGSGTGVGGGGGEGRGKSSANEFISVIRESNGIQRRPSHTYIAQALTCPQYSGFLVNMCGAFTDVVSPQTIAGISLSHINMALLSETVSAASLRREQKKWTSAAPHKLMYERHDIVSLLLLARGVQYFGINTLPLSPEEGDAITKRSMPLVAGGGRGIYEGLKTGTETVNASAFFFYGVPSVGKQK